MFEGAMAGPWFMVMLPIQRSSRQRTHWQVNVVPDGRPSYLNLVLVEALASVRCLKNSKEEKRQVSLKQMLCIKVNR
jgi:hypothetical protein